MHYSPEVAQEFHTGSLRPTARGLPPPVTPNEQLKDRLVETIEEAIGKPLLSLKPILSSNVNGTWQALRPLDSKWEERYGYFWVMPSGYSFPPDKISNWTSQEMEECHEYLDSGQLRVKKRSQAPLSRKNSAGPPSKYRGVDLDRLKEGLHVVLTRCLIAMLSEFQKDQFVDKWPIQPMITDNGQEGFPGYRWTFADNSKFKEFPSATPYISGWSRDNLISFLEAFEEGSLSIEKVPGYQVEYPIHPLKTVESKAKTYGYANSNDADHQDARLEPRQPGTSSSACGLNSLFGSMAERLHRQQTPRQSIDLDESSESSWRSETARESRDDASSGSLRSVSDHLLRLYRRQKANEEAERVRQDRMLEELAGKDRQILEMEEEFTRGMQKKNEELRKIREIFSKQTEKYRTEDGSLDDIRAQLDQANRRRRIAEADSERLQKVLDHEIEQKKFFENLVKEQETDLERQQQQIGRELKSVRSENASLKDRIHHLETEKNRLLGEAGAASDKKKELTDKLYYVRRELFELRDKMDSGNDNDHDPESSIQSQSNLSKKRPLENASSASLNPAKKFAQASLSDKGRLARAPTAQMTARNDTGRSTAAAAPQKTGNQKETLSGSWIGSLMTDPMRGT